MHHQQKQKLRFEPIDPPLDANDRFFLMRMMFGGQTDFDDFHHVGLDEQILRHYLTEAGFCDVTLRPEGFGLFADGSAMRFKGVPVSVNVAARACNKPGPQVEVDIAATAPAA